jgi:hypothetical protein
VRVQVVVVTLPSGFTWKSYEFERRNADYRSGWFAERSKRLRDQVIVVSLIPISRVFLRGDRLGTGSEGFTKLIVGG